MKRLSLRFFSQQSQSILIFFVLLVASISFFLFTQKKLIYVLIGIALVAGVAWCQFNLRRWIYLILIFMPLSPNITLYRIHAEVSAELNDFIVLTAVLVYSLNKWLAPVKRKKTDYYLFIPMVLYIMTCILSSLLGFYRHYQFVLVINSFAHLFKGIIYVSLYFIIFNVFQEEKELKTLLRIFILSFSLGAIITVYKYLVFSGGIIKIYRVGVISQEGINAYGVTLALVLIFFYNLLLQGKAKELFPHWLFISLWSLILLAMIATFSRTAWASLWGGIIFLTFIRKRKYIGIVLILVATLNFLLLRKPVEKRIKMTLNKAYESPIPIDLGGREFIWVKALKRIGIKNILGVGSHNFQQTLMGTTPHNQYITVLGENGFLGLFAFFFLLYRIFKAHIYLSKYHPLPFFRECAIGSLTAFIVLSLASFGGEFLYMPSMSLILILYAPSRITYQKEYEKFLQKRFPTFNALLGYKLGGIYK